MFVARIDPYRYRYGYLLYGRAPALKNQNKISWTNFKRRARGRRFQIVDGGPSRPDYTAQPTT